MTGGHKDDLLSGNEDDRRRKQTGPTNAEDKGNMEFFSDMCTE